MIKNAKALAFFRQSGWLMIASTLGGGFMYAVHVFARTMPKTEYSLLGTMLNVINLMGIPAIGLQTVFAQQAAAALDEKTRKQLTATVRGVGLLTFGIWICMALGALFFQGQIFSTLKIQNPTAFWLTVMVGLMQLWLPMIMGVLQGLQNFSWLGMTAILNGFGRFVAVAIIVPLIWPTAAGAVAGVFCGMFGALGVGMWQSRAVVMGPTEKFDWKPWLRRVVPLTLGLGATMFMLSADMIVVRSLFDEGKTGLYVAAGMIGRGLVFFTVPLTSVMFPKIVQSAARSEKSNELALALGATALLGGSATLFVSIFPKLPLFIVYHDPTFYEIAPLVPWFGWCMLPLTLSNVLINNLMARERFEAVPWILVVAACYGAGLVTFATSFKAVVQTLGVCSLMMLAVVSWFTWGKKQKQNPAQSSLR